MEISKKLERVKEITLFQEGIEVIDDLLIEEMFDGFTKDYQPPEKNDFLEKKSNWFLPFTKDHFIQVKYLEDNLVYNIDIDELYEKINYLPLPNHLKHLIALSYTDNKGAKTELHRLLIDREVGNFADFFSEFKNEPLFQFSTILNDYYLAFKFFKIKLFKPVFGSRRGISNTKLRVHLIPNYRQLKMQAFKLFLENNAEESKSKIQEYIYFKPSDLEAYALLNTIDLLNQNYDPIEDNFLKISRVRPLNHYESFIIVLSKMFINEIESARKILSSIDVNSIENKTHFFQLKSIMWFILKDFEKAKFNAEKTLNFLESDVFSLSMIGYIHAFNKNFSDAIKFYEKAANIVRRNPKTFLSSIEEMGSTDLDKMGLISKRIIKNVDFYYPFLFAYSYEKFLKSFSEKKPFPMGQVGLAHCFFADGQMEKSLIEYSFIFNNISGEYMDRKGMLNSLIDFLEELEIEENYEDSIVEIEKGLRNL